MGNSINCTGRLFGLMLALLGLTSVILPSGSPKAAVLLETKASRPKSNLEAAPSRDKQVPAPPGINQAGQARVNEAYGKLPLSFEANQGQTDPLVRFLCHAGGYTLFLTPAEAVFLLEKEKAAAPSKKAKSRLSAVLRMKMVGAEAAPLVEGLDQLPGSSNYFIGNSPSKWRTNIPNYARVQYRDVYPGVNLVYYGNRQQLEYDFVVAPGGDPNVITLAFQGAQKLRLEDGDLVLRTRAGDLRMRKPSIYQEVGGARQPIAGRYVLRGKHQIGFEVGAYDRSKTLIIDPVLSYSTYLGGSNFDDGRAITIDSGGNAYVTGRTASFNFPITIKAYDTTYSNFSDVFVTKLNAEGSALIYSTYLGGVSDDQGLGIVIDSSGNAYVTGSTSSNDYPTTPGAYQTTLQGGSFPGDAFVTKLNSAGTALIYSTYLGGNSPDQAASIAIDSAENVYVTGYTSSANFPTTPGAFQITFEGGGFPAGDAFITKLNNTGTDLNYSTFLGGSNSDQGTGIQVDPDGNAYLTGITFSSNFDVTPGAFQTTFGGSSNLGDAFATKLNDTGMGLVYSTYLGGRGDDAGYGIALAPSGDVYITGHSLSANFPTTPGVLRVSNGGITKTTDGGNIWDAINSGLTNPSILSLAISPIDPSIIYAGTSGSGIFKSTNGGASWSAINSGLTDLFIRTIAINPATPSAIYLGTNSRGVFRSTDSGSTWRAINTGQNGMMVNTLKIDPTNPSVIYAGTNSGLFKSTNSGAIWTGVNTGLGQNLTITALAIDPMNSSTVYAGISFGGVFKSTNGGVNWNATTLVGANIRSLAINPFIPSTLHAGTDIGIFRSTDGGDSWNGTNAGLTDRTVNALAIASTGPPVIFAGTRDGVFKSTDGGNIWGDLDTGLSGAVVNALAIDPSAPSTVYAGSNFANNDVFVTKLNAAGAALIYSTLLGGSDNDQGFAIDSDSSGNAYITGSTFSTNFPTTRGSFRSIGSGFNSDSFVTKLNTAGSALVYSTALSGFDTDQGFSISVDGSDNAYVTGSTRSRNFPITPGAFQSLLDGSPGGFSGDAFVTKVLATPSLTSDLSITMTASPQSGQAASGITYSITITNNGPETASSITVNDSLPSSTVVESCSSSPAQCFRSGNSVTFTLNSLEVGASATMTIFARVSCSIPSSVTINNTATVDSSGIDPDTRNNSATVTTTATNPTTTISPMGQAFPISGGNGTVNVNRGVNCPWTATSNASWINITFSTNCCNGIVQYSVAANTGAARIGTMTIAGLTFTVNQAGVCNIAISQTSSSFAADGGTGSVNVTGPAGCNWATVNNNPNFITITSGASGSGNGTVSFSIAANTSTSNRTGTIIIADRTFTVLQGAAFLDVPTGHPFYTEIGKLSARGITVGCGGGNFCPNQPVTREQMAAFIIRALGIFNPPTPPSQRFQDVPPSNPFYAFIEQMAVRQITLGCGGGNYCPLDPVLREQMAAFILRALGEFNPPTPPMQRFDDVPPSNPFYNFIDRLAARGITQGCSASPPMFCPTEAVTRGQMAVFLVRAFNL